jgi:hypothetical protein
VSTSYVSTARGQSAPAKSAERVVHLAGGLNDEQVITFMATLAASGQPGVVLLDSARTLVANRDFLAAFQPERVMPVGTFPRGKEDLARRLNVQTESIVAWAEGWPTELWKGCFPRAERAVICRTGSRRLLLQAAHLAVCARSPLIVLQGHDGEIDALRQQLEHWGAKEVWSVAGAVKRADAGIKVVELATEKDVADRALKQTKGPVKTLLVCNPADTSNGLGGLSALAPWLAGQKQAALLLTNDAGDNVNPIVDEALQNPKLAHADALLFLASLKAIPVEKRPNPVPGKDQFIEMEPTTPKDHNGPFTFATGRLFHDDPNIVLLMLARQRLLGQRQGSRKSLIVSNPGGGLPLLETFSRNTVKEFANRGYQATAFFGRDADKDQVRKLLPDQDIFLWEGHHKTMTDEYKVPEWTEPLPPAFIFLQSCLALNEGEAYPFLQRGALGVVGSSTRTYSGSGGAFTLCFFDALMYEDQTLGGALRQAKNFLRCYAQLKEKRLGDKAKLKGANQRSSWAFTLWGDPLLKLPHPPVPEASRPGVTHKIESNVITVNVPEAQYDKVVTTKFQSQMWPNARLAGLLGAAEEDEEAPLVNFVFVEVSLPKGTADKTPRLTSKIPSRNWTFCWDSRRRTGYLLVTPRASDRGEIRFVVKYDEAE